MVIAAAGQKFRAPFSLGKHLMLDVSIRDQDELMCPWKYQPLADWYRMSNCGESLDLSNWVNILHSEDEHDYENDEGYYDATQDDWTYELDWYTSGLEENEELPIPTSKERPETDYAISWEPMPKHQYPPSHNSSSYSKSATPPHSQPHISCSRPPSRQDQSTPPDRDG
jgi:hypothetical protein